MIITFLAPFNEWKLHLPHLLKLILRLDMLLVDAYIYTFDH